jgi:hypothetical protein
MMERVIISLEPEEVIALQRIVLDDDRGEALEFLKSRINRKVEAVLNRPHCVPVFEMKDKISDRGLPSGPPDQPKKR